MADDDLGAQTGSQGSSRTRMMQFLVVALLMIGEGVGVFLIANSMKAVPDVAAAAGEEDASGAAGSGRDAAMSEVELAECKPSNTMSGKLISLHLRVSGLVASTDVGLVENLAEDKRARIDDRINYVVRSAALRHLNEPGLETIKRRIKHELDELFEAEGLIKEIFIPELLQSGAGL
jgi:flagellar basal body-associated protein FliL